MSDVVNINDFKKEAKKREAKAWFYGKVNNTINWLNHNKDLVLIFGPAAIGAVTTGMKVVGKKCRLKKEKNLKELYCYDRSLGHYWKLRRELTNAEWVEIDKRKKHGERLADILDELKVLK